MTQHDDGTRLLDMLEYAEEAIEIAKGLDRADLDRDRKLNLALVRLAEIVGEAAARVSPAGRERLPGIPWAQMVGMRNRLVHGYDVVDFDVLWNVIRIDLPPLVAQLREALGEGG
ncbi:MAG: hypothetical protein BIFFINMI_00508 [Phycisphaerae bacterium]|nr:hypothetical protein [Phycisphaerae bacterium]